MKNRDKEVNHLTRKMGALCDDQPLDVAIEALMRLLVNAISSVKRTPKEKEDLLDGLVDGLKQLLREMTQGTQYPFPKIVDPKTKDE